MSDQLLFEDILQQHNARVVYEDRWLVYNNENDQWIVYQRKPRQKYTRTLVSSKYVETAISVLIRGVY